MMLAALGTLAILALIGGLFWIAASDKPLPPPRPDERSWSINYMTDLRRWTQRS